MALELIGAGLPAPKCFAFHNDDDDDDDVVVDGMTVLYHGGHVV